MKNKKYPHFILLGLVFVMLCAVAPQRLSITKTPAWRKPGTEMMRRRTTPLRAADIFGRGDSAPEYSEKPGVPLFSRASGSR